MPFAARRSAPRLSKQAENEQISKRMKARILALAVGHALRAIVSGQESGSSEFALFDRSSKRRFLSALFVTSAIAMAITAATWPVLHLAGPPTLRHDWIWPLSQFSLARVAAFGLSAWSPQGIGSPKIYPTDAPLSYAMWFLANHLGLRWGLVFLLELITSIGAWGVFRLTRVFCGSRLTAPTLAAAAYVLSPAFGTQLIAGHLGDLVALAGLPWIFFAFLSVDLPLCSAAIFLLFGVALCLVQVQFVVLVPIITLMTAVTQWTRRHTILCGISCASIFLLEGPTIYQLVRIHADGALLNSERTTLAWEVNQSAPFRDALVGQGYFAKYISVEALHAPFSSIIATSYFVIPALLLIAVALQFKKLKAGVSLLACYAVGVLILSGVRGPAGSFWSWAFINVKATSLFRELFHAAGLATLPLVVLLASLIALRRAPSGRAIALIALAALVTMDFPVLASTRTRWLRYYEQPAVIGKFLSVVYRAPGNDRILIFPGRPPEMNAENFGPGIDAIEYFPVNHHWTMFNYFPSGVEALLSDLTITGQERPQNELLRRMSVGFVLMRAQPHTDFRTLGGAPAGLRLMGRRSPQRKVAATLRRLKSLGLVHGAPFPMLVSGDYSRLLEPGMRGRTLAFMRQKPIFARLSDLYSLDPHASKEDLRIAAGCADIVSLPASRTVVDPHDGWVRADRFGFMDPALDYPLGGAIVTQKLPLPAPGGPSSAPVLWALIKGSPGENFVWGKPPKSIPPNTALAIGGYFQPLHERCIATPGSRRVSKLIVRSVIRSSETAVKGLLSSQGGGGALVFTDAFDSGWDLSIDGKEVENSHHFAADGFANGWVISLPNGLYRYSITYAPQSIFSSLTDVEFAMWCLILLSLFSLQLTKISRRDSS